MTKCWNCLRNIEEFWFTGWRVKRCYWVWYFLLMPTTNYCRVCLLRAETWLLLFYRMFVMLCKLQHGGHSFSGTTPNLNLVQKPIHSSQSCAWMHQVCRSFFGVLTWEQVPPIFNTLLCGLWACTYFRLTSYDPANFLQGLSHNSDLSWTKRVDFLAIIDAQYVANTRDTCPLSADKIISFTL